MAIRSSMHQAGAAVLDRLLEFAPPSPEYRQLPCSCGHTARYVELRAKPVLTGVGKAECLRPYYLCEHCHGGQFPVDVELDIENTEFSPGVRRMLAAVGHEVPFQQDRQQLELLAGLSLTTKAVERTAEAVGEDIEVGQQRELRRALQLELPIPMGPCIPILYVEMDGTGIPVVNKETEGRVGKQDGQPAHTREAKLGCVFTQTTVDEEGYPVRDKASTSYVGAIESCEEFGRRLYAEAWQRGWARAEKKVVLGDGAEWIWNQASLHFPDAIQIVDLYHPREHLWRLGAKLYPNDSPLQKRWVMVRKDKLDEGKIERLVALLAPHRPGVIRLQHVGHCAHVAHSRIEPQIITIWIKDDWHSVVNRGSHSIWSRRQDRTRLDPLSTGVFPAIPQPSECEQRPVIDFKAVRLLRFARPRPLVESVRRDETSAVGEWITERWLSRRRLRSGVNHTGSGGRLFRPTWNETPAHQRQQSDGLFWMLADHRDLLGGSDVVAGVPVFFARDGVEVLLD